jgi:outer membrane protein assembly factor BamB
MRWNILAAVAGGVCTMAAANGAEMLVCGFGSNKVYRYNMSGGLIGTLDAAGNLSGPLCARMGPDGKIYVASEGNNRIVRFSASTGAYIDDFINDPGLNSPTGITWDRAGNAYVASFNGNKVRKYTSSGGFVSDFVTAGSGTLSGADNGISFGPDGHLYVPSYNNNRVLKYNGVTGAFISSFIPSIGRPRTFEWFNGSLYITTETGNAVQKRNATNGVNQGNLVAAGSGGLQTPIGMAFGGDGFLYVTSANNKILKYNATTGAFVGVFADATTSDLNLPAFITIIPTPSGAAVLLASSLAMARRRR